MNMVNDFVKEPCVSNQDNEEEEMEYSPFL